MKKNFMYASVAAVAMFVSAANASTCGVVINYPAGGTSDRYARLLQKYNPEYQIDYKIGGKSVPAVEFIGKHPEKIYLGSPVLFGDNSPLKNPPIEMYNILISAPIMAVVTKPISWDDMLTKKLNIGVPGLNIGHHMIAEQLKVHNPNIQIIPTGGDSKALPMIMNGDLDVYFVSATAGQKWLSEFKDFKEVFRVGFGKPLVKGNITLTSIGFNGAFIHKNATPEQRQKAIDCLDVATKQPGWTEELAAMGAGPVNITGKEKDEAVQLYVEVLRKYGSK